VDLNQWVALIDQHRPLVSPFHYRLKGYSLCPPGPWQSHHLINPPINRWSISLSDNVSRAGLPGIQFMSEALPFAVSSVPSTLNDENHEHAGESSDLARRGRLCQIRRTRLIIVFMSYFLSTVVVSPKVQRAALYQNQEKSIGDTIYYPVSST
jgi:hypothetical protein